MSLNLKGIVDEKNKISGHNESQKSRHVIPQKKLVVDEEGFEMVKGKHAVKARQLEVSGIAKARPEYKFKKLEPQITAKKPLMVKKTIKSPPLDVDYGSTENNDCLSYCINAGFNMSVDPLELRREIQDAIPFLDDEVVYMLCNAMDLKDGIPTSVEVQRQLLHDTVQPGRYIYCNLFQLVYPWIREIFKFPPNAGILICLELENTLLVTDYIKPEVICDQNTAICIANTRSNSHWQLVMVHGFYDSNAFHKVGMAHLEAKR